MRIVDYKTYEQEKKNFFTKHNYDYTVETSPMDENGYYCKLYMFEDDSKWYEAMRPVFEKVEVEVKKVAVSVKVKLLETEYFNSDCGKSSYYYEKF